MLDYHVCTLCSLTVSLLTSTGGGGETSVKGFNFVPIDLQGNREAIESVHLFFLQRTSWTHYSRRMERTINERKMRTPLELGTVR